MLQIQGIHYAHPDRSSLFIEINLAVGALEKLALVGNNGSGKSTLLRIMAGEVFPQTGTVTASEEPYYIPQHFGQFDHWTVARALRVQDKLAAIDRISAGDVSDADLMLLDGHWDIWQRCQDALSHWKLGGLSVEASMRSLSGGQKTRVFLAGIRINSPGILLLDEPSNHLDDEGRALLYDCIQSYRGCLVTVSHDRDLLELFTGICELGPDRLTRYGGNFEFYQEQKQMETAALLDSLSDKERAYRKAKLVARQTMERQQKLDAQGKKKQQKAGVPTIALNTLRNNAEKSTSKIKAVHTGKLKGIADEVHVLRQAIPDLENMKLRLENPDTHNGKILVRGQGINYNYG
ncbi:MAG: ABC-F family ATP-binding cassette domain-containing protein, partial [Sphingobacteriales bacterium]